MVGGSQDDITDNKRSKAKEQTLAVSNKYKIKQVQMKWEKMWNNARVIQREENEK
jgi:hypothetical protein